VLTTAPNRRNRPAHTLTLHANHESAHVHAAQLQCQPAVQL